MLAWIDQDYQLVIPLVQFWHSLSRNTTFSEDRPLISLREMLSQRQSDVMKKIQINPLGL